MSLEQDNKVNDYSEKSIRILKGLQPVKQRPGMYTLTDCPLHIIQEVIDNATDEVLANFANRIILTEHADGSISVEDNGRGIPVGIHPEEKVPVVEIVFTRLHAGGSTKVPAVPILSPAVCTASVFLSPMRCPLAWK